MRKVVGFIRRYVLVSIALLLVAAYPLPAIADDPPADPGTATVTAPPADTTTTPPTDATTVPSTSAPDPGPTTTPGPTAPQGPSAKTYTYNPDTGLWQNQYYTWNPVTGQTAPITPQTYSYNPATGHWDTTDWIYDPTSASYVPNVVSVVEPPVGALTLGGPNDPSTQGPNSPIDTSNTSIGLFDDFYNASISNSIVGQALSGNANVSINTTGGNATSGHAMDLANIINLLQSTTNLQGNLATFSMDIAGNVQGDITIDPSQLSNAIGVNSPSQLPSDLTINSQANGQINNDVTLGAGSGNATVESNTTAGNATTGNADTVANIMNVINSIIASGQSFIGNINIFGNLDGDILMPQETLNNLLASNKTSTAGPNSPITDTANNTLTATLTDNNSINNTLNLNAQTGTSTVTDNTTAGDATTGNAGTNITVLNLTGKQVVGNDALLVFVNVLGKWVGMIVNAPAGATTAALCNCSDTSTAGPNSPINPNGDTNTDVNSTNNSRINNNVNLSSLSGDAVVANNTTAGNAKSGNATASVNLLNISTSSLSLANWFGILFINVFGSWTGSFGIDTAAGNPAVTAATGSGTQTTTGPAVKAVKVFSFTPSGNTNKTFNVVQLASATVPTDPQNTNHAVVLATTTHHNPTAPKTAKNTSMFWTAGSLFLLAGILSAEEAYSKRKESRIKLRKYVQGITVHPLKRY